MLLNRATLGLAKLASKEETRYSLQGIAIEMECATVTNGHYLVTVSHPQYAAEHIEDSYPETPGLVHREIKEGETVLVHSSAAAAAMKALPKKTHIPVLQHAAMSEDGKLVTNDLDSVQSFSHKLDGQFPDWRRVMPSGEVEYETYVDARYLKALAEYFIAVGNDRLPSVRMTIYADKKPSKGLRPDSEERRNPSAMRFDLRTHDGQDVTAILMPLRGSDESYPMRPDQVATKAAKEAQAASEAANAVADAVSQDAADMGEIPTPAEADANMERDHHGRTI